MTATVDICMYSDSVYYASPLCTVAQCMMLRRASPLSAAACKNYPAATSCPGSCFFPELLNRTQCRRPTDRARYQCCSPPPHCVLLRSMLLTTTQISTHTSAVSTVLQGKMLCCAESWQCAAKQCFCGRVGAGANIEACAGGTQRGPSPGPHRTRGGSSIFSLF